MASITEKPQTINLPTSPRHSTGAIKLSPETLQMLGHNWRGGQWAYYWTPDGERYYSKKYHQWRQAKISLWFPLNQRWPAVPDAWHDKNVYFSVHAATRSGATWQRATIATVSPINCVFAEFDADDFPGGKAAIWTHLQQFEIFPTCIVDSGGGLHCYWWLTEPVIVNDENRAYMRRCQSAWVGLTGGDDGAKDLARVLRLPGFQNRKPERGPDFPTVKIMYLEPRRLYPFSRIQALVDERIAKMDEAERQRIAEDNARSGDVASGAAAMLLEWAVNHANVGSRHNLALWLAGRLKAEGLHPWAASSVLREFARQVNRAGTRQIDASEMDRIIRYVWSAQ